MIFTYRPEWGICFMASPQLEKGYTRIANEILEALSTVQMSGSEWQFVMCLFRKTYGYNKSEDWITGSQIALMTGLRKERVSEAKQRLIDRKIVTEKRNKISFQKDYERWVELRKSVTVVTEKRNTLLRKSVNTKDNKETYTKDTSNQGLRVDKSVDMKNKFDSVGAEIIKAFELVDAKNKNYYANTTQRSACDFLIREYGLKTTLDRIAVLPKTNGMQYFPTITTPVHLRDKWVQLENAVTRKRVEVGGTESRVAF